ncbi:bifunctional aspartate kinase/homoserine dehydrogenase I [Prolixibacter sp. SD074]|jgi:aspartokinase/homoserine dehydrogenase 1|uniref:bifunctional aspartate kinase/homoserine dehydrogenase I n=1 Tax=Prolixibacter sp. SD074 TaxID=2652391 RepID=UPI00126C2069|nr:bifunctional aspartate kinase/homoserine dehydrogenase I [Prolixibacter sp. SD074]GET28073.1 bifunctional aspartate kinase/homoserine dehydrogenase I [Prolixibacter sp. SD074]
MKILKFGGTSVGSHENVRRIDEIVKGQNTPVIVVVSALSGITDTLLLTARTTAEGGEFTTGLSAIRTRHEEMAGQLFAGGQLNGVTAQLHPYFEELEKIFQGVSLIYELTPKTLDKIVGFGERMSSLLISEFLKAELIDSAAVIKTDENFGRAYVDLDKTYQLIAERCSNLKGVAVAPGFISSSSNGVMTTLGRGGSDYTAALFAAALDAEKLEIWTDVDGFMTADPRVISKAYPIPSLTYSEAMELSHFGAKVIYPPTILPVYKKGIPVQIKNTMAPNAEGTLIGLEETNWKDRPIKGISSMSGITLITVQGLGMIGVTGISARIFGVLARKEINVILISQASSENSISFAVDSVSAEVAREGIEDEFAAEIASGRINKITIEENLSIVAIVGEHMKHSAGIAGKLFHTIGKNGINVVAIAQGASEQNISWVVKHSDLRKTLNVVHESFFLSPYIELNIFLVGIGTVGRDLLKQIERQQPRLTREHRLKIKLAGVANSRKMYFNRDGIQVREVDNLLKSSDEKSNMSAFCRKMIDLNMFNSVFVDCTASAEIAGHYHHILDNFISVVAANKVAASSSFSRYKKLKDTASKKGVKFLFETNVGAGLPLISTINDLQRSGDRIQRIEAVLSGTLNFIFNTLSEEIPLSMAIRMAKDKGYAEPDPRVDLSGIDVVRKLVILARESGYEIEKEDVKIEPFIPQKYFDGTLDEFWETINEMDEEFEQRRKELVANNQRWRFVGKFENRQAEVALRVVDARHPFFDLEGSNNIVLLTSERYNEFPMLIKGYGAGAAVTAAGVFADLIKVSNI